MDVCVVKTLRPSESVVCATACWLNGTEGVAVSYGRRVHIYDHAMNLLKAIRCNDVVSQMAQMFAPGDEHLFLLSKNSEYALIRNGSTVESGRLFKKQVVGIRPTGILRLERFITILLSNSRVIFATHKDGRLVFHDRFNYFGSYKILDLAARGDKAFFLLEDCEGKTFYTLYGLKVSGEDFMHYGTGSFSSYTHRICFFRDKAVLFQQEKLALYVDNKVAYQTNFANTDLGSWIETDEGVLLCMRSGEFIMLEISEEKIRVAKIHDVGHSIDVLIRIGKDSYFGGSRCKGKALFRAAGDELLFLHRGGDTALARKMLFDGSLRIHAEEAVYTLRHCIEPRIRKSVVFNGPVKKMWPFGNKLFVSLPGKSVIYDTDSGRILREFDEIKEAHVHRGLRFNTENLLIETSDGACFNSAVEWEGIILSSYYKEYLVIYTGKKIQLLS